MKRCPTRIVACRRQREAELGAFLGEEAMRDLDQHAAAVAGLRVGAHGAAMIEVVENLQALLDDDVRLAVLHVGDEADAAGVLLIGRIVKALCGWECRIASIRDGAWSACRTRWDLGRPHVHRRLDG